VAIVVLEAVAFGLERIVVLVLDLPAAAPGGHKRDDRVGVDRLRAGPGVAVEHVARGIGGDELATVHRQRVVAVAQRQIVEPAIGVSEALRAGPRSAPRQRAGGTERSESRHLVQMQSAFLLRRGYRSGVPAMRPAADTALFKREACL